ncbi:MAG: TonB-dependent receptor family protein, partial [Flavobacteriales bacterium]|nr:TonB-dependent receptor family protein [Flavobacteriales bacterium]
YRDGLSNNDALLIYRDLDGAGTITRTTNRTEDEEETDLTRELALSYRKDFPQKDRRFTADVKWMDNDDIELSTLTEVSDPGSTLDQRSSNTENERNILLQWDYVHPFHKDGRFEMGMRSTLRDIENDYLVEQLDPDGDWMPLEGFDEFFTYKEHIHAGYVMAGDKRGRFSYQAGLRAEYTDLATELVESGITNPRSYLDLFPSAHLSHEIDSLSTIQLSYSRRINRPRFRNLLPFFTFSDNRVFFSGNPDLNPEYTHSVELGYMRYFQGGSALTSLYYRHGTGVVERITVVDSTGITRIFPVNLSTRDAV